MNLDALGVRPEARVRAGDLRIGNRDVGALAPKHLLGGHLELVPCGGATDYLQRRHGFLSWRIVSDRLAGC